MTVTSKVYYITGMDHKLIDPKSSLTEQEAVNRATEILRQPGFNTPNELLIWIEKNEVSVDGLRKVMTKAAIIKIKRNFYDDEKHDIDTTITVIGAFADRY